MTMTYALILLILLLCQIAFVVMVWVYQTQLIQEMDEGFDTIWKNHIKEPVPMDSFQTIFKCCGSTGYSDYRKNNETLPGSCCGTPGQTCEVSNVYNQGCKTAFHSFWSKNIEYIKFGGLAIALIEFVGVVFACCLSNSIRNERRRAHY
uniref:Tetraspanin n=1 Tax=Megaselia scalaris TaxID=36166 RepID=T1GID6_MEGSC